MIGFVIVEISESSKLMILGTKQKKIFLPIHIQLSFGSQLTSNLHQETLFSFLNSLPAIDTLPILIEFDPQLYDAITQSLSSTRILFCYDSFLLHLCRTFPDIPSPTISSLLDYLARSPTGDLESLAKSKLSKRGFKKYKEDLCQILFTYKGAVSLESLRKLRGQWSKLKDIDGVQLIAKIKEMQQVREEIDRLKSKIL